jgi:hypothetical protein
VGEIYPTARWNRGRSFFAVFSLTYRVHLRTVNLIWVMVGNLRTLRGFAGASKTDGEVVVSSLGGFPYEGPIQALDYCRLRFPPRKPCGNVCGKRGSCGGREQKDPD